MSLWKIADIKSALTNNLINSINLPKDVAIEQIAIDSRFQGGAALFIALVGENNDGHNFLEQAFNNGAVAAIIERIPPQFENDKRLILVKNTKDAFNDLAAFARERSKAKIIAITGSVGKTSTKEMLKIAFASQGKTYATIGNLNNHFGVPLTLCNFPSDAQYGIFEVAMNHLGEIEPLSKLIRPDIAIISTIAKGHIGNFNNQKEIALAKAEIFAGMSKKGYIIINNDNEYYNFLVEKAIAYGIDKKNIANFGTKETSYIRLNSIQILENLQSKVEVTIKENKEQISYIVNSINKTLIFNSLIVVACLKITGINLDSGLKELVKFEVPQGRGNVIKINKNGKNLIIIDDSYNANPASIQAGIKFLADLKIIHPNSRSLALLGDMLELGSDSEMEHRKIANHISEYNVDLVFLVGKLMGNLVAELKERKQNEKIGGYFLTSAELAKNLLNHLQDNDIILIKGSHATQMEKIVDILS